MSEALERALEPHREAGPFARAGRSLLPASLALFLRLERLGLRRAGVAYGLAESYFGDALLLEVPPRAIRGHVPGEIQVGRTAVKARRFFAVSGDWDLDPEPFDHHRTAVEMRAVVRYGARFRESEAYARLVQYMRRGVPRRHSRQWLDSVEKVDAYFERYLVLAEHIRAHGFRSQRELGGSDAEIGVAVGSRGELLRFRKGGHRLALARLLDLDRVVVSVRFVHPEWLRGEMRRGRGAVSAVREGLVELQQRLDLEGARGGAAA